MKWIPLWLVIYFSEEFQDRWTREKWTRKTDTFVLEAYEDCTGWIKQVTWLCDKTEWSDTTQGIIDRCQNKLDKFILPEMKARNMEIPE
jgi:hypothetical protein